MKDFQLIKILKTFSKDEMKSFRKFVNSPFFNTSKSTVQLFSALNDFYPNFSSEKMNRQGLFSRVYGNRKYSAVLFNKLASNLIKLSLEFIRITNNPLKQYSLLRGLRKKRLDNLFRSYLNKTEKELERENLNEGDTVYQILINTEKANFNLDSDNYQGFEISNIRNLELNILYFFERVAGIYIEKTNIAVTQGPNNRSIIKYLDNSIDYEVLYEQISASDLFYKKRILHYLSMILLHKTRNEKFYRQIKASLFDTVLWDVDVINLAYIYLLDFITYKVRTGDDSFLLERHSVYKKIEQDCFVTGKVKIIFTFFRNFILSGINTGDFSWSKYVLNRYIKEIEGKGNSGIKYYFDALILFNDGKYESALNAIKKMDLKNLAMDKFGLSFDIRFLKFKIFFELRSIEDSLAMIDAFEHYLKNDDKLNNTVKPAYKNFIKFYKKLVTCMIKEEYSGLENIKHDLQKEKTTEKKWLLRKIDEMKG